MTIVNRVTKLADRTGVQSVSLRTLAAHFYAGRYREVLAQTESGAEAALRTRKGTKAHQRQALGIRAMRIAAGCFVGDLQESHASYRRVRGKLQECRDATVEGLSLSARRLKFAGKGVLRKSPRDTATDFVEALALARFALVIASARSGDRTTVEAIVLETWRGTQREPQARERALLFQAMAGARYFSGRFRDAARLALSALAHAEVGGFGYAQLLATDLRGHALVAMGKFHQGVHLLQRALHRATTMELSVNLVVIRSALAIYRSRFELGPRPQAEIEELLEQDETEDSYSRRTLLTALSSVQAATGHAQAAAHSLDEAQRAARRLDAPWAERRTWIAALGNARWRGGAAAVAEVLSQNVGQHEEDILERAERLGYTAFALHAQVAAAHIQNDRLPRKGADEAPESAAYVAGLDELEALVREQSVYPAAVWLAQLAPTRLRRAGRESVLQDDERSPLLIRVFQQDASVLSRLLHQELLGYVPEALGLQPNQRLLWLPDEGLLLVENFGNIRVLRQPPPAAVALAAAIAKGEGEAHSKSRSRESLVRVLWGVRRYDPERHDAPLRTAVHRLRGLLGEHASWLRTSAEGYLLKVAFREVRTSGPMQAVDRASDVEGLEVAPLQRSLPLPVLGERGRALVLLLSGARDPQLEAVMPGLQFRHEWTVAELAKALKISESSALRELRPLLKAGVVRRVGAARATRYGLANTGWR